MASRTVMEHSNELEQALRYVVERLQECPTLSTAALVSDAGPRFDLSPVEQESLMHLIRREREALRNASRPAEPQ